MKYKTQEETPKDNSFLQNIVDLLALNKKFSYAIRRFRHSSIDLGQNCKIAAYIGRLYNNWDSLIKLAISLNPEHKEPTINVELSSVDSVSDLKTFEEKYYNMLKEIGKNALEQNEIETVSYITKILSDFEHYFCTLDEDNDSRETSS